MTSIFSRLRSYAESQSSRRSAQSAQPPPTTSTTVTTPTHDDQAIRKQSITESPEFADTTRKICPDLDLFPQDFETEPTAIHRGLPPPIRRGISTSSKLPTPSTRPAEYTDAKSPLAPPATGDSVSPKASPSSSSSGNTPPGGRGFHRSPRELVDLRPASGSTTLAERVRRADLPIPVRVAQRARQLAALVPSFLKDDQHALVAKRKQGKRAPCQLPVFVRSTHARGGSGSPK
ncbi:hypothetical protein F5148DRAFT_667973 [Russula earlei]|uniref:Uncharacterized protein n=1 Tax=Russula earlei TaxID=71964 RepID=A0ACC0UES4_9AGAM|nr:hypothetical protein F5148DRAFT_667973 [Russula earlei]